MVEGEALDTTLSKYWRSKITWKPLRSRSIKSSKTSLPSIYLSSKTLRWHKDLHPFLQYFQAPVLSGTMSRALREFCHLSLLIFSSSVRLDRDCGILCHPQVSPEMLIEVLSALDQVSSRPLHIQVSLNPDQLLKPPIIRWGFWLPQMSSIVLIVSFIPICVVGTTSSIQSKYYHGK